MLKKYLNRWVCNIREMNNSKLNKHRIGKKLRRHFGNVGSLN